MYVRIGYDVLWITARTYEVEGVMGGIVKADVVLGMLELDPVGPAVVEKLELILGTNELTPEVDGAVGPAILL